MRFNRSWSDITKFDYSWGDIYLHVQIFGEKKIQYAGHRFCTQLFSAGPEFTKFSNLNRIGDGNNKNPTRHVFKYKQTKWSC